LVTIMIHLDEQRASALKGMALREKRRPRAQAEIIIERALNTVQAQPDAKDQ
jgi:hypothetical protein